MKTINIKMIAGCLLLASLALNSFGQTTTKADKEKKKKQSKVTKGKVPKEVIVVFYKDHPTITEEGWYVYPSYDSENNWWDDWDESPYVSTLSPDYYEVEFTEDNTPTKAIYSKKGERLVTHKKFKNEIPKPVATAINNGPYKTWKVGSEKEEIFKDKEKMKVYKIELEKGKEKHKLYYQEDGKLLKDKKVS